MKFVKTLVAVNPSPPQAGIVLTLEGTNLILTILISSIGLLVFPPESENE